MPLQGLDEKRKKEALRSIADELLGAVHGRKLNSSIVDRITCWDPTINDLMERGFKEENLLTLMTNASASELSCSEYMVLQLYFLRLDRQIKEKKERRRCRCAAKATSRTRRRKKRKRQEFAEKRRQAALKKRSSEERRHARRQSPARQPALA